MVNPRNPDFAKELGDRIAGVAKKLGGKQELARCTGISISNVYRYINGERTIPARSLIAIAEAAEVDLQWLATGNEFNHGGWTPVGARITEEGLSSELKVHLLQSVFQTVDEAIVEKKLVLSSAQKARLVASIYEMYHSFPIETPVNKSAVFRLLDFAKSPGVHEKMRKS